MECGEGPPARETAEWTDWSHPRGLSLFHVERRVAEGGCGVFAEERGLQTQHDELISGYGVRRPLGPHMPCDWAWSARGGKRRRYLSAEQPLTLYPALWLLTRLGSNTPSCHQHTPSHWAYTRTYAAQQHSGYRSPGLERRDQSGGDRQA